METCERPNQNDFNSIELRASSISFKIDNCSYLNLQNKIVSILNESNVTVEDLDNLIQFLTDSKKTATLKFQIPFIQLYNMESLMKNPNPICDPSSIVVAEA